MLIQFEHFSSGAAIMFPVPRCSWSWHLYTSRLESCCSVLVDEPTSCFDCLSRQSPSFCCSPHYVSCTFCVPSILLSCLYTGRGSRPIQGRTIRRGQFGADNSARQFGPDNSAQCIYYKFYTKSRSHSAIFFSSIPLPFQQFFIRPASISATFFINSYP